MIRAQAEWIVRKRDGRVEPFDISRIERAMMNAYRAELDLGEGTSLNEEQQEEIQKISKEIAREISTDASTDQGADVEKVQDIVEVLLMRNGLYGVARRYIVYRAEHAKLRALRSVEELETEAQVQQQRIHVILADKTRVPFDQSRMRKRLAEACDGLEDVCSVEELLEDVMKSVFNGISVREIYRAMILATRTRIERDPAYGIVASRLMLNIIYNDALGSSPRKSKLEKLYRNQFEHYIIDGITADRLTPALREFDLTRLAGAMVIERDSLFQYLGLQTIYDRYLIHVEGRRIETPQFFWMRVSMGLAVNEENKEERAIEFYNLLSTLRFTSATPTLFNSATLHPQLSSCYLSTVDDCLDHIFKCVADNAKLSKWAGGLGNDWTQVRATNSHISGTNGQSQGVIPFLKVVNDTAVAVNQGGKRKGAVCSYLESWHLDVEEFLDLRKNTGDDRRRTHDMHTANWIPDLFMKRVQLKEEWTLFSPDEVPDLHDLTGKAFEERYAHYEQLAEEGEIRLFRKIPAVDLWRKMLTRLFETGHPWITWKDPSNLRSPQDHCGVVHSSNLCTEILLNTSEDETAVCNLGSINLSVHIVNGELDLPMLQSTIKTAMRMLDNVIDINYYPTPEAKNANQRHRPVGLGMMAFQDALQTLGISYASNAAVEFADRSMEAISYYAILASSELAAERGRYGSYEGSKWDRDLLPIDTLDYLEEQRGMAIDVDRSSAMDWSIVRKSVKENGMRNSNCMAIAPTATISTIIGVTQSIEPSYKHLYVKSNLSGEFTQVNVVLVDELKANGLWNSDVLDQMKYHDGSIQEIAEIPEEIRKKYLTAFEVEPQWLIECASRRQKWIDMGQSLNLYLADPSGKKLNDMYLLAWNKGLKTTYYLRSLAATQVEKSTIDVNKFGIQPKWMKSKSASSNISIDREEDINQGAPTESQVGLPTGTASPKMSSATAPASQAASTSPSFAAPQVAAVQSESEFVVSSATAAEVCDPNNPDCEACQ